MRQRFLLTFLFMVLVIGWGNRTSAQSGRFGIMASLETGNSFLDQELSEWRASVPELWAVSDQSSARYEVDASTQEQELETCQYTNSASLTRVRLTLLASIIDLETSQRI